MLELGLGNVAIRHGDGLFGWSERGPYDRILLTGAIDEVPDALLQQLAKGGVLIAPFQTADGQQLLRIGADGTQGRLAIAQPLASLIDGVSKAL
jgi:protein-L-isoaspartate(D-aspartate) O-methyltransferase